MARHCPECVGEWNGRVCPSCGFRNKPSADDPQPSVLPPGYYAALALTAKQWYSVCKFFPNVARRDKRYEFADVGPHNPLDSQVKLGPLMRGVDLEADEERRAIQGESGA